MKKYLVYMHKNKINENIYIGITSKKPEARWGLNGVGYKYNSNKHFWKAIEKYGWANFDHLVLEENLSLSDSLKKESFYSKLYNTTKPEFGYNQIVGRKTNSIVSEQTRKKLSANSTGKKNPNYGKKASPEKLEKLRKNAFIMNGKDNPVSRAVKGVNLKTNEVLLFESANQAAKYLNLFNNGHIIECCRRKRKSCKGYTWKYQ
jgi:group I intron endonuclease